MASHTPGPWYRNIKPATKYTTVWSGRNTHVAYVATSGLTPEEVEANICLIAAAPRLLAAAEAVIAATGGAPPDWLSAELAALEDAIAAAKPQED